LKRWQNFFSNHKLASEDFFLFVQKPTEKPQTLSCADLIATMIRAVIQFADA